MKINKKGFTLMELLVTVLIMIILVTIATPMYQRATEKSRRAEVSAVLKRMSEAKLRVMDTRELKNWPSSDAQSFNKLDVDISLSSAFNYSLYDGNFPNAVCAVRSKGPNAGTVFLYLGEAASDMCNCGGHALSPVCTEYCTNGTKFFCSGSKCDDYGLDSYSSAGGCVVPN